ncbi:glycoside hydrolase family 108 protein [Martelella alba]|nr:glycoside hydrolase family 108 protein [Martelella alba]
MDAFAACLQATLREEGGYSDDPKDPGGATMHGITQETYDRYRSEEGLPVCNVKTIGADEVGAIYRHGYWDPIGGSQLPPGIDLAVFDAAVNSGPQRAVSWLQQALNQQRSPALQLAIDGVFGQQTGQALEQVKDIGAVIDAICTQRLAFLKTLPGWLHFGTGWSNRIRRIHDEARSRALPEESAAPYTA